MLRYLALATAIVLGGLGIALAFPHGPRPGAASTYRSDDRATPGPATRDDPLRDPAAIPVGGEAAWALSALPACFHQTSFVRGTAAFVRSKRPAAARRVPAGATLVTADCRLRVGSDDARVERGENALHVPAPARFYVAGNVLVLETRDGERALARTYALATGGAPHFVIAR